jgi:hypothetical protein
VGYLTYRCLVTRADNGKGILDPTDGLVMSGEKGTFTMKEAIGFASRVIPRAFEVHTDESRRYVYGLFTSSGSNCYIGSANEIRKGANDDPGVLQRFGEHNHRVSKPVSKGEGTSDMCAKVLRKHKWFMIVGAFREGEELGYSLESRLIRTTKPSLNKQCK